MQHIAMHIRQPEVASLVAIRQARVLQAEQVQDRRLQVVRVDGVRADVEAELVGGAVVVPGLKPPPATKSVNENG